MKSLLLHKFFFILLLVVYIYSIVFIAIPLSTKIILEGIGLFYCFRYLTSTHFFIQKEYVTLFKIIAVILLWDLITCFVNGSFEFHYFKVILPMLGSIFGAQLLYEYSQRMGKTTDDFLLYVVITIFLESILSIFMKMIPGIYTFLSSILVFELGKNVDDIFTIARFYGIGNAIYFGVLPSCALGLMTAVFLMMKHKEKRLYLLIMFVVIAFVSFLIARTAIILFLLSFLLILIYLKRQSFGSSLKFIIAVFCLVIVSLPMINDFMYEHEELNDWALGFIENRDVETGSAASVIKWWKVTEFDAETLALGDAQYENSDGSYYKKVDIGYFREIFYGGLIGLFLNLFFHYKVLAMIYRRSPNRNMKYFLLFLFLTYLVILGKGDAYVASFYILYLVYYTGGVFKRRQVLSRQRNLKNSTAIILN